MRLPDSFPREVEAIACDLDGTLVAGDHVLRPRTLAALRAVREAGLHLTIVTGRMFRSMRPFALEAGVVDPVICYQGAVVADPATGEFLRHEPIPVELAREAIAAVQDEGFSVNCYVDDEFYVAHTNPQAEFYAEFQGTPIEIHEVGDLLAWLERAPTKLVVVSGEGALDELEAKLQARFDGRLHVVKSIAYFLEMTAAGITKRAGLEFFAQRVGIARERTVGFGDGENDVELLEWAGYGVATANAHERTLAVADWVCPSVEEEGVAQVLEAFLHSRG